MFGCNFIATKAITDAKERIKALVSQGFSLSNEKIIGHKGEEFGDYWIL